MDVSQPLRLVVDLRVHAEELRRFEQNIVRGPGSARLRDLVFGDRRRWLRPFLGAPRCDADDGAGQSVCARAVALREAVRHGWDAEAVEAALLGSTDPTLR